MSVISKSSLFKNAISSISKVDTQVEDELNLEQSESIETIKEDTPQSEPEKFTEPSFLSNAEYIPQSSPSPSSKVENSYMTAFAPVDIPKSHSTDEEISTSSYIDLKTAHSLLSDIQFDFENEPINSVESESISFDKPKSSHISTDENSTNIIDDLIEKQSAVQTNLNTPSNALMRPIYAGKVIPKEVVNPISKTELIEYILRNIFASSSISSVNLSYFGAFFGSQDLENFEIIEYGEHKFICNKLPSDLIKNYGILRDIKTAIDKEKAYIAPLVKTIQYFDSTIYSLAISNENLKAICNACPEYTFSILNEDKAITEIKLVISCE